MLLAGAFIDGFLNPMQDKYRFLALFSDFPAQMRLRLVAHQIVHRRIVGVLIHAAFEFADSQT